MVSFGRSLETARCKIKFASAPVNEALGVIRNERLLHGGHFIRERQQFVDLPRLYPSLDTDRVESLHANAPAVTSTVVSDAMIVVQCREGGKRKKRNYDFFHTELLLKLRLTGSYVISFFAHSALASKQEIVCERSRHFRRNLLIVNHDIRN
jgi:hypothetical protein